MDSIEQLLKDPEISRWFYQRPVEIQRMILLYPYDQKYRMKEDAPYGITSPGTIVEILSYFGRGEVRVLVRPENLTSQSKEHIALLCNQHRKNYDEMISRDHHVVVDVKWLGHV